MNKTAIKNYAVWARNELIKQVTQKAYEYEVTNDSVPSLNTVSVNGRLLSNEEKNQLNDLIIQVNKYGFVHVVEEIAYTWFNRFIALRYMEVNNYLPQKVRVFTNENNEFKPEILTEAIHLDLDNLDKQKVFNYIQNNNQEDLYKYLLLSLCNDMNKYLPDMFTSIKDYKALLLPDNLLKEDSVLDRLIKDIDEDSFKDQVQIIGWMYQYYIQMPKDELIHAKKQYKTDDIPFVTQLFTPDWIVIYMVENTIGNYYIHKNPNTRLYKEWKYFIKNNSIINTNLVKIENLKFLDPCIGSGHILVYAFDLFISIYEEAGYSDKDAAVLILQNNLYGLDLDERACQLAYFALMMKARSYNRKILTLNIKPNIYRIKNIEYDEEIIDYVCKDNEFIRKALETIYSIFKNAHSYGSLLSVSNITDDQLMIIEKKVVSILKEDHFNLIEMILNERIAKDLLPMISIIKTLKETYDFVVTNPPYLNSSLMPKELKEYVAKYYKDCKSDLFAVFIKKCIELTKENGYIGMLTPYVWMFISSYEKLRTDVLNDINISSLIQLEYNAFEAACVPVATFVFHNTAERYNGSYIKLSDFRGSENQAPKTIEAINNHDCGFYYETSIDNFNKIPGSPIAYDKSIHAINNFENKSLGEICNVTNGLFTCNNNRFLRLWYEVNLSILETSAKNKEQSLLSEKKWYPYNKGGDFRRWYGNQNYVVNFYHFGDEISNYRKENGQSTSFPGQEFYFKQGITWSALSSSKFGVRYTPSGFCFDIAGSSMFTKDIFYFLGLLASEVTLYYLNMLNPTINYQVGDIRRIPFVSTNGQCSCKIESLVKDNISFSKSDWDSFETSWNFEVHPLVKNHTSTIKEAYDLWNKECNDRFNTLKSNEEELNRIFIGIYGLQDELDPCVEDKDVTVRKADLTRDIKSLISYAVGCMLGRYSLDVQGLAYAGGEFDNSKYKSYLPDKDNIIPICDEEYFEDDIVSRFVQFVKVVYGSDTLEENLQFIANALGGSGNSRDILRNYFLNDFFKDHCNTYQVTGSGKRPIYWQFDSGKNNSFKALIYMHRYTPDLIAGLRTTYIHPLQSRLRTQIDLLNKQIDDASNTSEKVKLSKQLKKINDQLLELNKYEEKIHHYADMMIDIDLDDGVKTNYAKFDELLSKLR